MLSERELQIHPIVPESVLHNTKVLTQLHNLTSSLLGIGAGILGLESYPGFLFYLFFSLLVKALLYVFRIAPSSRGSDAGVQTYFQSPLGLWTAGLTDGLTGFVLTWTLFYGLVRA